MLAGSSENDFAAPHEDSVLQCCTILNTAIGLSRNGYGIREYHLIKSDRQLGTSGQTVPVDRCGTTSIPVTITEKIITVVCPMVAPLNVAYYLKGCITGEFLWGVSLGSVSSM